MRLKIVCKSQLVFYSPSLLPSSRKRSYVFCAGTHGNAHVYRPAMELLSFPFSTPSPSGLSQLFPPKPTLEGVGEGECSFPSYCVGQSEKAMGSSLQQKKREGACLHRRALNEQWLQVRAIQFSCSWLLCSPTWEHSNLNCCPGEGCQLSSKITSAALLFPELPVS